MADAGNEKAYSNNSGAVAFVSIAPCLTAADASVKTFLSFHSASQIPELSHDSINSRPSSPGRSAFTHNKQFPKSVLHKFHVIQHILKNAGYRFQLLIIGDNRIKAFLLAIL